jgi:glyoxylase-like metal-dependent hydrolase (beta-lactamase superfamily II)
MRDRLFRATGSFLLALWLGVFAAPLLAASGTSGVQRLYILNCGEGMVGDISRWSPGVNVGQSMPFVTNCYLIRHGDDWMLWDTGLADRVADMPDGQRPADPRAIHWRLPQKLSAQLQQLGLEPSEIKYVAVSHSHGDHIGNVGLFPRSTLLVQKAEYEWPSPTGESRFPAGPQVKLLEGDYDIFGDGSVMLISTPGHTPGHQVLLLKLPKTGAVLLSGDAVHFRENWGARRVPEFNVNKEQTSASMQRISELMAKHNAQLWINHDRAQRDTQKLAPAFYE